MNNQHHIIRRSSIQLNLPFIDKELPYYNKQIVSFVNSIKRKLNYTHSTLLSIPFKQTDSDVDLIYLVMYCINKQNKSDADITFISHYLSSYNGIMKMLTMKKLILKPIQLLESIASKLKIESHKQNTILFRVGESPQKVSFNIKGKVSILVRKETEVLMNLYEYIKYVKYLSTINENELMEWIIMINKINYSQLEISLYVDGNLDIDKQLPRFVKPITYPVIDNENINQTSPEDYVNRFNPILLEHNYVGAKGEGEKKLVTIIKYCYIRDIPSENIFGEESFNKDNKYLITAIAKENCSLGYLKSEDYITHMKDYYDKVRKGYINDIVNSSNIFSEIKIEDFEKSYFNYFAIETKSQGDVIFEQGSLRKKIYFLIEGEIETSIKTTFDHLDQIINSMNKSYSVKQFNKKVFKDNMLFANFYNNEIINLKVMFMNGKGVFGLDDYVDPNDLQTYIYTVTCHGRINSFYVIDKEIFDYILIREPRIQKPIKKYLLLRKKIMLERVLQMRRNIIKKQFPYFNLKNGRNNSNKNNTKGVSLLSSTASSHNNSGVCSPNTKSIRELTKLKEIKQFKHIAFSHPQTRKNERVHESMFNINTNNNNNNIKPGKKTPTIFDYSFTPLHGNTNETVGIGTAFTSKHISLNNSIITKQKLKKPFHMNPQSKLHDYTDINLSDSFSLEQQQDKKQLNNSKSSCSLYNYQSNNNNINVHHMFMKSIPQKQIGLINEMYKTLCQSSNSLDSTKEVIYKKLFQNKLYNSSVKRFKKFIVNKSTGFELNSIDCLAMDNKMQKEIQPNPNEIKEMKTVSNLNYLRHMYNKYKTKGKKLQFPIKGFNIEKYNIEVPFIKNKHKKSSSM